MSEKSEAARKKYQAPPFEPGSTRASEAARKGHAKSVESRKKRKLMREDLANILAKKFSMEQEKERLNAMGFNPKTVQEALIMAAIVKDIQSGNSRVLLNYAQLLGEINVQDTGTAKVDAILDEIDRRAEEPPEGETGDGDT